MTSSPHEFSTPNWLPLFLARDRCAKHGLVLLLSLTPVLAPSLSFSATLPVSVGREHQSFDSDWRFSRGDPVGAEKISYPDAEWRGVDLPHDWSIEGPYDERSPMGGTGGYLPAGVGWYRKIFHLPETARNRLVRLQFDGVYQHSTVWVNGHKLGTRPYGYATFSYDLTPYLNFGDAPNVVAVRVDNSAQPNSRWYSGSGIYRHTWLTITDRLAIAPQGIFVTTPEISPTRALVRVITRVRNERNTTQRLELIHAIAAADTLRSGFTPDNSDAAKPKMSGVKSDLLPEPNCGDDRHTTVITRAELAPGAEAEILAMLDVPQPQLWSPESPHLYCLRSAIRVGDEVVDSVTTTFGVRQIEYDIDRGFLLNGSPVKLRGMCVHHDGGAVGAAVPEAVLERRLRLLLEMGCNAVRCSHNPMAPEFYDLCDQLGILVMNEAFDEWTLRKPQVKFGYSDIFNDWYERDLVDFIRRDRNHPCIVMWSAGNEIAEQRDAHGPTILRKLVEIFHREDPTRPVTAAMDNVFTQHGPAPHEFTDQLDIVGYNYVDRWGLRRETQYGDDRARYPKRKFIGTEDTTVHSVRGEYAFGPLFGTKLDDHGTTEGSGPEGALYVAKTIRTAALWRFVAMHDYVIGHFGWTGIDYLGEAHWPRKAHEFGVLDTCGFKKDSFYFYQSLWTTPPMIHLLPHWNWPTRIGRPVPVVAYSNCAAVELFLNGRSLGTKAREFPAQGAYDDWNAYREPIIRATTSDLQFVWDVLYEPGELKAVGYDRRGNVVTSDSIRTAGIATTLEATVDRTTLIAGARDVAHVTVRALDADGVFMPVADDALSFQVTAPGKLIAVDNGDPLSHASYQASTRKLYNGMALALVQSTADVGLIRVTVRAGDLRPTTVEIPTVTASDPNRQAEQQ